MMGSDWPEFDFSRFVDELQGRIEAKSGVKAVLAKTKHDRKNNNQDKEFISELEKDRDNARKIKEWWETSIDHIGRFRYIFLCESPPPNLNNYVYNSEHPNKDQYEKVIEDSCEKGYAVFDVLPFRRKLNGKRLSDSGFIACLECLAEYNRKRWG
jgi:hypothetical protein